MRPYVRAANVGWDGLRLDDVKSMNFTDDEMLTYRLEEGDLLVSEASGSAREVGKAAIWNGEIADCCFQNTLIRVRPRGVDPRFLLHFLRHQAETGVFAILSRGVGIFHLGRQALAALAVPLPSTSEQRRIVVTLDKADELRAKRRTATALLDDLVDSIFLEMFGDPRGGAVFPAVTFGAVFADRSAGQPKTQTKDFLPAGDYPLIDQGHDLVGGFTNDQDALCGVRKPVIVFGDHTRVLKFIDFEFGIGADGVKVLTVSDGFDPVFAFHALRLQGIPSAGYSRHYKFLKSTTVPNPPLDLQLLFRERAERLRSASLTMRRQSFAVDDLFASLQQRAFRGEL
jgi:type I restriction enzyme S subunit